MLGYVGVADDGSRPPNKQSGEEYTAGQDQYHADGQAAGRGVSWDAPVWPCSAPAAPARAPCARAMLALLAARWLAWTKRRIDGRVRVCCQTSTAPQSAGARRWPVDRARPFATNQSRPW